MHCGLCSCSLGPLLSLPPPGPQVNLKLFAPEPNRRKTVLLFVIRDKSKTPLEKVGWGAPVAAWAAEWGKQLPAAAAMNVLLPALTG